MKGKGVDMTRRGAMTRLARLARLASVLVLTGCSLFGDTYSYRYRMTVEVETPDGLKAGSAVREISYSKQRIKLPDMAGAVAVQRGEAVAVDLPGGQTLFALLSTNGYDTLQAAFGDDAPATLDAAKADGRSVELRPKPNSIPEQSGYPMLVRFRDTRDPKSVELVSPDDLAASFGSGVRLRRIIVQITDAPVTTGIEKKLVWLPVIYKMNIGSDFHPRGIPVGNFRGLFTSENYK